MFMNKTVVIDTFAIGTFHEMFNAAFVKSLISAGQEIVYYGTNSSISNQQKMLSTIDLEKITYNRVSCILKRGVFGLILRYLYASVICVMTIRKINSNRIVILNNNPFLTLLYGLINKNVNIICHGELELIEGKDPGKLARVMTYLLRRAFVKEPLPDKFHYLVLGDQILSNLKGKIKDCNLSHFDSIDHPYLFKQLRHDSNIDEYAKIGIVGITTPTKGLDSLRALMINMPKSTQIFHIGKIDDPSGELKSMGLNIVPRDENNELPREKYEAWIRRMDYILFLYPSTNYRLTASGAIFECLSLGVPVISLRNDYFDYIRRKVGDIGFFYDNFESLQKDFGTDKFYNANTAEFNKSIEKGRVYFSPEFISKNLVAKIR